MSFFYNIYLCLLYCLFALNKSMDLWTAISQAKTMPIKTPAVLSHKESNTLWLSVAGFFVGIDFQVVSHVQRSLPIQNLAKPRPDYTRGVV